MSQASLPPGATPDARRAAREYTLSLLSSPEEWDDASLRERWGALLERYDDVNALYASPAWFDHLRETRPGDELALAVARDRAGNVEGIVPLHFKEYPFQYYLSSYPLLTLRLKAAHVLGSVPLLPAERGVHAQFRDALLGARSDCDCIYMDTVPIESDCREFVSGAGANGVAQLVYAPGGKRPWHLVELGPTADAYFGKIKGKLRYELKRRTKRLDEHCGGKLSIVRVDSEAQVAQFVADAAEVSRNSWQQRIIGTRITDSEEQRAHFAGLARRGLLRSYLLRCGERPCAFVVGYQFNQIFHYVEIGYDREFAEFSPGMILYYLLVQDLFAHRTPSLLNFGMGDADYKQRFGNVRREDISILILRKNLLNRLRVGGHSAFRSCVSAARGIVRRVRRS
ncbi:MAG TPA: GNAT family N-acetyltransferase [Pyrinomonadaceae bacterium]|jgi:CelD/BcsL family acetyltransferase involved in cellulose biosynthesis|nr:GNAT family N-acetyltransferase [Pyrinomonadaceae bacterium]